MVRPRLLTLPGRGFMSRFDPRRKLHNPPARRRLGCELLEERCLLTAYIVSTANDEGSGVPNGFVSLREAITAANTNAMFGDAPAGSATGDTIAFSGALAGATLPIF